MFRAVTGEKSKKTARMAFRLSAGSNRILTTLLIGNNIVNITASTIGTVLFIALLGEGLGPTISTIVITVVGMLVGAAVFLSMVIGQKMFTTREWLMIPGGKKLLLVLEKIAKRGNSK